MPNQLTELRKKYRSILVKFNSTVQNEADAERYAFFMDSLKNVYGLTDNYFRPDENGNYMIPDEGGLKILKNAYNKSLLQCSNVIMTAGADAVSLKMKEIAEEVKKSLDMDMAALETVNPNQGLSLGEIIEKGRTNIYDLGNKKIEISSNQLSARIPMKLRINENTTKKGYFTKTKNVDPVGDCAALYDELTKKYPGVKPVFDELRKNHIKEYDHKVLDQNLHHVLEIGSEDEYGHFPRNKEEAHESAKEGYKAMLQALHLDMNIVNAGINDPNFPKAMAEMFPRLANISLNYNLYVGDRKNWLGIKEGANIDKRNAAMAAMANLIDKNATKKGLIADAKPVTIIMNGVPTSGTFMDNIEGENAMDENSPIYNQKKSAFENPAIYKDLASIQIIDYICGNIDRHLGNFIMKFGEVNGETKLVGIYGIDNDLSWGMQIPKTDGDLFQKRQVQLNEMGVLGEEEAKSIMLITKETAYLTLAGYGLSEAEMEAGWKRIQNVQKRIEKGIEHYKDTPHGQLDKGFIRVIPEDKWKDYKLDELAKFDNRFKVLAGIEENAERYKEHIKNNKYAKSIIQQEEKKFFDIDNKKVEAEEKFPEAVPYAIKNDENIIASDRTGIENPDIIKATISEAAVLDNVSGEHSKRIPVTFMKDGKPVNGFFTAANTINSENEIKRLFEGAMKKYPEWSDLLTDTFDYIKQDMKNIDSYNLNIDSLFDKIGTDAETRERFNNNQAFSNYYKKLVLDSKKEYIHTHDFFTSRIKADEDGVVDNRNISMYKMAEQLGVSRIIAPTTNMKLQIGDNVVNGVFMETVPGINSETNPDAAIPSEAFDNAPFLKDVADLQILDFICQNIDRNEGNYMCRFKDGKCEGIVGIDNDMAFGMRDVDKMPMFHQVLIDEITVITEETADRIRNMDPAALEKTLDGQGLTRKEIDASLDRFAMIRDRVEDGRIKVVKDEEWKQMKMADLSDRNNYFSQIGSAFLRNDFNYRKSKKIENIEPKQFKYAECTRVDDFSEEINIKDTEKELSKQAEKELSDKLSERMSDEKAAEALNDRDLLAVISKSVNAMYKSIKKSDHFYFRSSEQYRNLRSTTGELVEYIKNAQNGFDEAGNLAPDVMNHIRSSVGDIGRLAGLYVDYKLGEIAKDKRTAKDIEAARLNTTNGLKTSTANVLKQFEVNDEKKRSLVNSGEVVRDKIKGFQEKISGELTVDEFKASVASIVYLNVVNKNIVKLGEQSKVYNAINQKTVAKNAAEIMECPAFSRLMAKNPEELKTLAASSNGNKLVNEFLKCEAKERSIQNAAKPKHQQNPNAEKKIVPNK